MRLASVSVRRAMDDRPLDMELLTQWLAKRAETEKDGAIVENVAVQMLTPTAFSSVQ